MFGQTVFGPYFLLLCFIINDEPNTKFQTKIY